MCFEDSDAYRGLEVASSVLATREEPDLREQVDEVVALDGEARVVSTEDGDGQLYRERDNRDDGQMSVWVPTG